MYWGIKLFGKEVSLGNKESSINNIYRLDGRVPIAKAIPFGLQHILAMFVSNLAPITLIAAAAQPSLTQAQIAVLLQNAMFVAGIATLVQLYPVWKIGSKLPVVMGVSFTFVTILCTVAANYGYPAVVGSVIIGGLMEGTLGLLAKYWRKIITPVVAASVVTAIGFSLFTVGARSFGGGYNEDFGSAQNLILGTITLAVCLIWNIAVKGYMKQLSVLAGLIVGYIVAIFMGKVDLSAIMSGGLFSLPHFMPLNRNSIQGQFFQPVLFSWYQRQKQLEILQHLFPVAWTERLQEKKFQVLLPVMDMHLHFQHYLVVRP